MVMALRLGLSDQNRSSKERGFDPHPSHPFILLFLNLSLTIFVNWMLRLRFLDVLRMILRLFVF